MLLSLVLLLGVTPVRAEPPRLSNLEFLRNTAFCFKKPFRFKSSDLRSDTYQMNGEIPFPGKSKKYRCWIRATKMNAAQVGARTDPDFPVLKTHYDSGAAIPGGSEEYNHNFAEYEQKIAEYWKKPGRDKTPFANGVFRREGAGRFPIFTPKVLSAEETSSYLAWVKAGKPKKDAKKWATVKAAPADPGVSDPQHYVKPTEAFFYRADPTAALEFPLEMKPVDFDRILCRAKTSGVDVSEMTVSDFVDATGNLLSIAALEKSSSGQGKTVSDSLNPRIFQGEKKMKIGPDTTSPHKKTEKSAPSRPDHSTQIK